MGIHGFIRSCYLQSSIDFATNERTCRPSKLHILVIIILYDGMSSVILSSKSCPNSRISDPALLSVCIIKICVVDDQSYFAGGFSNSSQEAMLRSNPDIIVATPGRLIDHVRNAMSVGLDDIEVGLPTIKLH